MARQIVSTEAGQATETETQIANRLCHFCGFSSLTPYPVKVCEYNDIALLLCYSSRFTSNSSAAHSPNCFLRQVFEQPLTNKE